MQLDEPTEYADEALESHYSGGSLRCERETCSTSQVVTLDP